VRRDFGYPGHHRKQLNRVIVKRFRASRGVSNLHIAIFGGVASATSCPRGRGWEKFTSHFFSGSQAKTLEFKELQIWQSLCSLNDVRWQIEGAHALGAPGNKLCTVYNLLWVVSATIHTQGVAPGDNRMGNFVVIFWEVKLELASNPYRGRSRGGEKGYSLPTRKLCGMGGLW